MFKTVLDIRLEYKKDTGNYPDVPLTEEELEEAIETYSQTTNKTVKYTDDLGFTGLEEYTTWLENKLIELSK